MSAAAVGGGIGLAFALGLGALLVWLIRKGRSVVTWIPAVALTAVFGLVGLVLVPWGGWYVLRGTESATWPTTEGMIVESYTKIVRENVGVGSRRKTHRETSVRYAYEVDGDPYEGSTIAFASDQGYPGALYWSEKARMEALVADHRRYDPVTVAYDPTWPEISVLRPGVQTSEAVRVGVGVGALLVSALALVLLVRDPRTEQILGFLARD